MGFMDKVKSAAQDVAQQAKSATSQAQTKIEQTQLKKKMDETARELGYLVYKERAEGTPAGAEADKLIEEIGSLKTQIEAEESEPKAVTDVDDQTPPAQTPPAQTSASEPAPGDFKL